MKPDHHLTRYVAIVLFLSGCNTQDSTENMVMAEVQQMLRGVVTHDGIEREFFVHVPAGVEWPHCLADAEVNSRAVA